MFFNTQLYRASISGLLFAMCALLPCDIWSQKQIEVSDPIGTKSVDTSHAEEIFAFAEVMPRFPGCEDLEVSNYEKSQCAQAKLIEYVAQNLKYPEEAKNGGTVNGKR